MAHTLATPSPENAEDSDVDLRARVRSLGDEVYETLLSRLISLKITPGTRISVEKLVREFGVSQTPIRAALIRLEAEGLVAKAHNIGYSAAPMPTRKDFEAMYEMRLLLEPYAARRAAQRITRDALGELEALAGAMATTNEKDAQVAYGKFALLDSKFHGWIAAQSGNELLADSLSRLYAHTHLFRLRFHSRVTEEAIKEHDKIVKALKKGNADGAEAAMHDHILRSRERMEPFFALLE
jgi:DNA-binding GntR family transcriptional regulator